MCMFACVQSIEFHRDFSKRTMQVALNDESEYSGGRLVFVTGAGLLAPPRPAGSATIHTNKIVHGVSTLRSGIRYGLFLCDTIGDGDVLAIYRPLRSCPNLQYVVDSAQKQIHFYREAVSFLSTSSDKELYLGQAKYAEYLQRLHRKSKNIAKNIIAGTGVEDFPDFVCKIMSHVHQLHPRLYVAACGKSMTENDSVIDYLGVNLVEASKKQISFMKQVISAIEFTVKGNINRYQNLITEALYAYVEFLYSLRYSSSSSSTSEDDRIVPSFMVDYIWHTHMGFHFKYAADCLQICGFEVDHVIF